MYSQYNQYNQQYPQQRQSAQYQSTQYQSTQYQQPTLLSVFMSKDNQTSLWNTIQNSKEFKDYFGERRDNSCETWFQMNVDIFCRKSFNLISPEPYDFEKIIVYNSELIKFLRTMLNTSNPAKNTQENFNAPNMQQQPHQQPQIKQPYDPYAKLNTQYQQLPIQPIQPQQYYLQQNTQQQQQHQQNIQQQNTEYMTMTMEMDEEEFKPKKNVSWMDDKLQDISAEIELLKQEVEKLKQENTQHKNDIQQIYSFLQRIIKKEPKQKKEETTVSSSI
jgi:hypothetical protein